MTAPRDLSDDEREKLIAFANAILDGMEAWLLAHGIVRRYVAPPAVPLASDETSGAKSPACVELGLCDACGQIHPPTDNHVNGGSHFPE